MDEKLIKKLREKFGDFIILDENDDTNIETISTGSLAIDVSTGIGGIPKKRITTIYGADSSGKTSLGLSIANQALIKGEMVAYIDVEQSLDYKYARAVMGDTNNSNLLIAQPETAEKALVLIETLINGDEKIGLGSGKFGLILLDSIAALSPEKEQEKELTDKNIALSSQILTAFFRRNMHHVKSNNIALVFINQVRAQIGSYHGGYTMPGGFALKHYSSLILFLSPGEKIVVGNESIGMLCKFTVKKNKLAAPFRSYTFPLMFGKGIDYNRDTIDFALMLGVLKKRGSFIYFEDENLGLGMAKASSYLKSNILTLDRINKACYTNLSIYRDADTTSDLTDLLEEIG